MNRTMQRPCLSSKLVVAASVLLCSGVVHAADSASLLQVLQAHYPQVLQWDIQLQPTQTATRRLPLFSQTADLTIRREGELFSLQQHTAPAAIAYYRVAGWQTTLVAQTHLTAGAVLQPTSVRTAMRNVMRVACQPAATPMHYVGLQLRRTVQRHELLCAHDLATAPLIAKGMVVSVRCRTGKVIVTAQGQALTDAQAGQWMRVRMQPQHTVVARVEVNTTGEGIANACS